jgi:hypothetical protein
MTRLRAHEQLLGSQDQPKTAGSNDRVPSMSMLRVCSLVGRLPWYLSPELAWQRQYCSAAGHSLGSQGILTEYSRYNQLHNVLSEATKAAL